MASRGALIVVVALAGCGASTADFIGTWQYEPGAITTYACGDPPQQLGGMQLRIVDGTTGDIELQDSQCPVDFTVSGDKASGIDKACHYSLVGSGCPAVDANMHRVPFTLRVSGGTLTIDAHFSGMVGNSGCTAHACTGTTTGTAHRVQ